MALTTADEIRLRNQNYMQGFEERRALWLDMAKEAYNHTKATLNGNEPKPDDVAPHLELALEVRDEFVLLKAERRATAQYWSRLFANLIIAETWSELG